MPTGYTAAICEGEESFAFFVLKCARAFGACIEQKDDPLNALPEVPATRSYHSEALDKARARLKTLKKMSKKAREAYGTKARNDDIERSQHYIAEKLATRARLLKMIDKVKSWVHPTSEHAGLKNFMLDQLQQTLNYDGDPTYYQTELAKAEKSTPMSYYDAAVESAQWDIEYHRKHDKTEDAATESKRAWVRELYKSLSDEKDLAWALMQK